jgi:hypothetical protein
MTDAPFAVNRWVSLLRGCAPSLHASSLTPRGVGAGGGLEFELARAEAWLELPLDKHVAMGIVSVAASDSLPPWRTIKGLSPEVSARYQFAARKAGRARGVPPIHLEYLWWRV